MEVDHLTYGDQSSRAVEIVHRVNHPAFGLNWDPGNAFAAGEDVPYPDGYDAVRDHVRHVHFKDARIDRATGRRTWALDGAIDWAGQIAALQRDGYEGYISVETHMRPLLENTAYLVQRLQGLVRASQVAALIGSSA